MKSLDSTLQEMFKADDRTIAKEQFEKVFYDYYISLFLLAYKECRSIMITKEVLFNLFDVLWATWIQRSCQPAGFIPDTAWLLETLKQKVEEMQYTEETSGYESPTG